MRLVFLSDTHSLHRNLKVPEGDVLLHSGDFSGRGRLQETIDFLQWYDSLPHKHKVLIAGNHDFICEDQPAHFKSLVPAGITYLSDTETEIEGIRIYGSPWTPAFMNWAFNRERGADIRQVWDAIPEGTDVLLTHGPPYKILDKLSQNGHPVGCRDLLHRIGVIKPAIHSFGHIHEAYGHAEHEGTLHLNVSVCNLWYDPVQAPVVVEWENRNHFKMIQPPANHA